MGECKPHRRVETFHAARRTARQQTVQALAHVSFTVDDGEIVALIGPSGCGKTTALRIAMGLESASGGRVWSMAARSRAAATIAAWCSSTPSCCRG